MVITGLTRNQLNRKVPWVRIPPSPPEITPVVGFPGCWLFFLIRCKAQAIEHCISRSQLRAVIQMCVDVCRSPEVAVTKPLLNLLHRHTVCQKERSTAMPLRYNYDKPEKPRTSRVFGYLARFFILFQTEKSSREVVIS